MDPDSYPQIIILIVLLSLSSFFSMAETALTSLSNIRLRNMVDENVKNALLIQKVKENSSKLLSAILIGNNLVNIGASALATSIAIEIWGNDGVGIATGILTMVVLVFGEITPKTYATNNAEKISIIVIKPIYFCMIVFTPVITILNVITGFLLKLLGENRESKKPLVTESELRTMVDVSHEEGVLEREEKEIITNVVDFGNVDAKQIMVPRTDLTAISIDAQYVDVKKIIKNEEFMRYPVYKNNLDNIVGIADAKNIMFYDSENEFKVEDIMEEPFYTYESKPASELFREMKDANVSLAVILDEYGGTSGIVTMEDIISEIVGDIGKDDGESEEISVIKEDEYIIDGTTKLDDVNDMTGTKLESEDVESIGGFVIDLFGRFPQKGESVEKDNLRFEVIEIDKNRIEKLKMIII
ncbi:MAG: HlyC/CorC family transporter [Firmicutes bacterium]|nr:HlyC/CorC family transporter [Bacillota bacterium]